MGGRLVVEAMAVAAALTAGVDWRVVSLLAAALWAPVPAAVAIAAAATVGWRAATREASGSDVLFAETVAGELRAGSSLRAGLRVACKDRPGGERIVRRLEVGEPLPRAVEGIGRLAPSIGPLVEAAVMSGAGAGRMLPIFEELVVHAAAEEAARSEVKAALASVKASMSLLVGAPVAYLVWSGASGRLGRLLALPGGLWLGLTGAGLFIVGVLAMVVLARGRR